MGLLITIDRNFPYECRRQILSKCKATFKNYIAYSKKHLEYFFPLHANNSNKTRRIVQSSVI